MWRRHLTSLGGNSACPAISGHMASPNTLKIRESQLHVRRTLCGPHDTGTLADGKPSKPVPVADKPFVARNGHKYMYRGTGEINRLTNKRPSRTALKRRLGGKAAVRSYNEEVKRLIATEHGE